MVEVLVEYEYISQEEDELTIKPGDVITNVVKQDGGWWEGEINGKKGMFPDNFVKEIQKTKEKEKPKVPEPSSTKRAGGGGHVAELANRLGKEGIKMGPRAPVVKREKSADSGNKRKLRAKAAYSYSPENDDELALDVGDVVEILKQEEEGWWEGTVNGKSGMFPSNFVEVISEDGESPKPAEETTNGEDVPGEFVEIHGKKIKGVGLGNIFSSGPIKLRSTAAGSKKGEPEKAAREDKASKEEENSQTKKAAPPTVARELSKKDPREHKFFVHLNEHLFADDDMASKSTKESPFKELEEIRLQLFVLTYIQEQVIRPVKRRLMMEASRLGGEEYQYNYLDLYPQWSSPPPISMDTYADGSPVYSYERYTVMDYDDDYYDDYEGVQHDKDGCYSWANRELNVIPEHRYEEDFSGEYDDFFDASMNADGRISQRSRASAGSGREVYIVKGEQGMESQSEPTLNMYGRPVASPKRRSTGRKSLSPKKDVTSPPGRASASPRQSESPQFSHLTPRSMSSVDEVPIDIGELSNARETPPPKMTFRKRRGSRGSPKDSPNYPMYQSTPNEMRPPIKKMRAVLVKSPCFNIDLGLRNVVTQNAVKAEPDETVYVKVHDSYDIVNVPEIVGRVRTPETYTAGTGMSHRRVSFSTVDVAINGQKGQDLSDEELWNMSQEISAQQETADHLIDPGRLSDSVILTKMTLMGQKYDKQKKFRNKGVQVNIQLSSEEERAEEMKRKRRSWSARLLDVVRSHPADKSQDSIDLGMDLHSSIRKSEHTSIELPPNQYSFDDGQAKFPTPSPSPPKPAKPFAKPCNQEANEDGDESLGTEDAETTLETPSVKTPMEKKPSTLQRFLSFNLKRKSSSATDSRKPVTLPRGSSSAPTTGEEENVFQLSTETPESPDATLTPKSEKSKKIRRWTLPGGSPGKWRFWMLPPRKVSPMPQAFIEEEEADIPEEEPEREETYMQALLRMDRLTPATRSLVEKFHVLEPSMAQKYYASSCSSLSGTYTTISSLDRNNPRERLRYPSGTSASTVKDSLAGSEATLQDIKEIDEEVEPTPGTSKDADDSNVVIIDLNTPGKQSSPKKGWKVKLSRKLSRAKSVKEKEGSGDGKERKKDKVKRKSSVLSSLKRSWSHRRAKEYEVTQTDEEEEEIDVDMDGVLTVTPLNDDQLKQMSYIDSQVENNELSPLTPDQLKQLEFLDNQLEEIDKEIDEQFPEHAKWRRKQQAKMREKIQQESYYDDADDTLLSAFHEGLLLQDEEPNTSSMEVLCDSYFGEDIGSAATSEALLSPLATGGKEDNYCTMYKHSGYATIDGYSLDSLEPARPVEDDLVLQDISLDTPVLDTSLDEEVAHIGMTDDAQANWLRMQSMLEKEVYSPQSRTSKMSRRSANDSTLNQSGIVDFNSPDQDKIIQMLGLTSPTSPEEKYVSRASAEVHVSGMSPSEISAESNLNNMNRNNGSGDMVDIDLSSKRCPVSPPDVGDVDVEKKEFEVPGEESEDFDSMMVNMSQNSQMYYSLTRAEVSNSESYTSNINQTP